MKYTVMNHTTEQTSEHRTWQAAFNAAGKYPETDSVVVIEKDRDGSRTYDLNGEILDREFA